MSTMPISFGIASAYLYAQRIVEASICAGSSSPDMPTSGNRQIQRLGELWAAQTITGHINAAEQLEIDTLRAELSL